MMTRVKDAEQLLQGAYALNSAEDNIDYYKQFAPVYDEQYAVKMGYNYPAALSKTYSDFCNSEDVPVADIGCGTGLVANELNLTQHLIDGIDISNEMLAVAREKSIYRDCYQIDLTTGVAGLPRDYGAVVSAGTFTFGHLGPETLLPLLKIGRVGALYCIGVNARHFDNEGFASLFKKLQEENRITEPVFTRQRIYSDKNPGHANDIANIAVYRKL